MNNSPSQLEFYLFLVLFADMLTAVIHSLLGSLWQNDRVLSDLYNPWPFLWGES